MISMKLELSESSFVTMLRDLPSCLNRFAYNESANEKIFIAVNRILRSITTAKFSTSTVNCITQCLPSLWNFKCLFLSGEIADKVPYFNILKSSISSFNDYLDISVIKATFLKVIYFI